MFTGIITDIGEIVAIDDGRFRIACAYDAASIAIGASIAHDGCCLTVTHLETAPDGRTIYDIDASNETLSRTPLGGWTMGRRVNLERSLRAGDELGGHMVAGHVDAVARIVSREQDGQSFRFEIEAPTALAPLIAPKG